MSKTVRDFKNFVLKETGLEIHFRFTMLSESHRLFWNKLNDLGARNKNYEDVPDIDASVKLTKKEWHELEIEFRNLSLKKLTA